VKQRVITAVVLAPLAIALVLLTPTPWLMLPLAVALLLGLWEWTRLVGLVGRGWRAGVLFINALLMLALALYGWPTQFEQMAIAGDAWWLLACVWLLRPRFAAGMRALPLKLLVGSLLILPTWCAIGLLHVEEPYGPRWTLFGLFLVWAADTFAYFVGSQIGGPKLAPSISPGKTWAGFFGGIAGACLICLPAAPLLGVGWERMPELIGLAFVVALAAVVGDLFESLIKRQAGAKDSGTLIPGHGGVMDRIDSVVAALPVFAIGKLWLGL